ncbi:transglutaminase family protein [soil metagenome]
MAVVFDIVHTTKYVYKKPVSFGEHKVMFRPRASHDMRVLATDLRVSPSAHVRLVQDVHSNSVALVQPLEPASTLEIVCSFTVEHVGTFNLELPLDPSAMSYPFEYSPDDRFALQPDMIASTPDKEGKLLKWAWQFIKPPLPQPGTNTPPTSVQSAAGAGQRAGQAGPSVSLAPTVATVASNAPPVSNTARDVLVRMNEFIRNNFEYAARETPGTQSPLETLALGSGSCRDFAMLMIEAVRRLGYAARFVSGYLYSPALDGEDAPGTIGAGATHAWLHVYLPGAGWVPFDPTNNLTGGTNLIRVGEARDAAHAAPVSGSWSGDPEDFVGLEVDVQVRRRL